MCAQADLEQCPDCGVWLPKLPGEEITHRYIGASPSCWDIFAKLNNAGEPPLAPGRYNALITDAYAAQHHGTPSPQAIQSVAVHLLALYAVLDQGLSIDRVFWIRQHAARPVATGKHNRYHWLTPPDFSSCVTIADVAQGATPEARTRLAQQYVTQVWERWSGVAYEVVTAWYRRYIQA